LIEATSSASSSLVKRARRSSWMCVSLGAIAVSGMSSTFGSASSTARVGGVHGRLGAEGKAWLLGGADLFWAKTGTFITGAASRTVEALVVEPVSPMHEALLSWR
jgi:hypothetical protein